MSIRIYYHVSGLNNFLETVDEQITYLDASGLLNKVEQMYIGFIGDEEKCDELSEYLSNYSLYNDQSNFNLNYLHDNVEEYEVVTAQKLWEHCQKFNGNKKILYLHSKCISHYNNEFHSPCLDWRRYMEYFLIERYEECLKALNFYDTVGVTCKDSFVAEHNYFDGNFWWANSNYIRTLKSPEQFYDDNGFTRRILVEQWIGSGWMAYYSPFDSSDDVNDHYNNLYSRKKYESKGFDEFDSLYSLIKDLFRKYAHKYFGYEL